VENKPGASGNIATEFVVRAQPDGHTLLVNNNTLTINSALGLRQSFHPQKDLKPVAAIASTPIVLAVNSSLPVRTVDELLAYAKAQGGKLSWSSCGNGTAQHFAGARFADVGKVQMVHIPYRGCAPAIIDGLSGTVPVLLNTIPNLDTHVQSGKLRYLAVAAPQRLSFKPDLPTVAEHRLFPEFEFDVWFGLLAPAGLPGDVQRRLEQEVLAVMEEPETRKAFTDRLYSVRVLGSKDFEQQIAADLQSWKRLADQLQVKLD
jgi:tripartite-type tricarboxylate transporter receptor subunit TctC